MEAISGTAAIFAECPVWLAGPQRLYWVDCAAGRLFSLNWRSGQVKTLLYRPGTLFAGLVKFSGDQLLLLTGAGAMIVDQDGHTSDIAFPQAIDTALFNDAKCDPSGALWIGLRSTPNEADGSLLRLDRATQRSVIGNLGIPNGPAFDRSGQMLYLADSLARTIDAYSLDAFGQISFRRRLLSPCDGDGQPDGMTVDAAGFVFVALFDGGAVLRLDPKNASAERIVVPARQPTSCTFGGPDLATLFVTVANGPWPDDRRRPALPPPADPQSPSLYALTVPAPGFEEPHCTAFFDPNRNRGDDPA